MRRALAEGCENLICRTAQFGRQLRPRPSRMKAKCPGVLLDCQHLKSGRRKPHRNRVRIDGDECVANVDHSHSPTLQAIGAYKNSAGLENSPDLCEEPILQRRRRHVMQHGEGNNAGELPIGEGHRCRIAHHDADVAAAQSRVQRRRNDGINLDCRQTIDPLTQHVGGKSRAGSKLQH